MLQIKTQKQDFPTWLKRKIRLRGTISAFIEQSGLSVAWTWVHRWKTPKPWQVIELAKWLSIWTGEEITSNTINDILTPDWRTPKGFGDWLRWEIEQKGSCNEFALSSGLGQSAVRSWVNCQSFPVGKVGQIEAIASALSTWTGKTVTHEQVRSRIASDPQWQKYPAKMQKRLSNASV
jgi:hypothetical protein